MMSAKFDAYSSSLVKVYWADFLENEAEARREALEVSKRLEQQFPENGSGSLNGKQTMASR